MQKRAEEKRRIAEKWGRQELLGVWDAIKAARPIPGWPDGTAFEYLVIRAFDLEKAHVRWPYNVVYPQKFGTMEQIDGLVYMRERVFLVESKDHTEPAAIEAIAKLRFRLESRPPGTMGILFSVRNFTLPTEVFAQFASPLNVLLWGQADLDIALEAGCMTTALEQKLEYATEEGLPLYPLGS